MEEPTTQDVQTRFDALAAELTAADPQVRIGRPGQTRGFGTNGLTVAGSIFAMVVKGRLVVKVDRQRVDALVAAGAGERLETSTGKSMKEWVSLGPLDDAAFRALVLEAYHFVAPPSAVEGTDARP
jgi:hypothetical protein